MIQKEEEEEEEEEKKKKKKKRKKKKKKKEKKKKEKEKEKKKKKKKKKRKKKKQRKVLVLFLEFCSRYFQVRQKLDLWNDEDRFQTAPIANFQASFGLKVTLACGQLRGQLPILFLKLC
ncbi:hypothetical protein EAI_09076 [Harpegnathos saltator]|uniref:Uncharacterized protein n=1 Tax=Harpegnathos saltator TaxID=610380 RepID=E2C6J1_HARSA|nr:hypothetical protein EAI_09076 [Harpegnathos saltator]